MLKQLIQSLVRWWNRKPPLSETVASRLARCNGGVRNFRCEHCIKGRCTQTGKSIRSMTRDAAVSCPIGLWPATYRLEVKDGVVSSNSSTQLFTS